MNTRKPEPGVSRQDRLSDQGLARLEKQLESGINISDQVLTQWIRRYGEPALEVIKKHGRYHTGLD